MTAPGATPGSESIWLWIGTIGMALGMLAFIARGWNVTDEEQKRFYVLTIFIPATAAVAYFSMATGFGLTEITVNGQVLDIYWARYADWLITTPLLLIDLALLAQASRNTIYTLVGLDVLMILTGLVGALAATPAIRIVWWGISTALLLFLLYFLVQSLNEAASSQTESVRELTTTLRNMLIVLWLAYPVVWILGTEGTLALIPLYVETAAFMVLDLTAKVGFGYVLLRSHNVLDQVVHTDTAPSTAVD